MRSRVSYPVMLGKNLGKGLLAHPNDKMGGYDLLIVWLKKRYPAGAKYDPEDIEKIDAHLHFCDRSSVEQMIGILEQMLEQWKED